MTNKRTLTVKESQLRRTRMDYSEGAEQAVLEARIEAYLAGTVNLIILRDGVFLFADIRRDAGDECVASEDVADILVKRGDAKRV